MKKIILTIINKNSRMTYDVMVYDQECILEEFGELSAYLEEFLDNKSKELHIATRDEKSHNVVLSDDFVTMKLSIIIELNK